MNVIDFEVDNTRYRSTEHYIQAKKASFFNDDCSESKILRCESPFEAKRLGSTIKNFNAFEWEKVAKSIAVEGVFAKFTQNQAYQERLMGTDKLIVECSDDRLWGTGVHFKSNTSMNPEAWYSKGLMSEVYEAVKEKIKALPT